MGECSLYKMFSRLTAGRAKLVAAGSAALLSGLGVAAATANNDSTLSMDERMARIERNLGINEAHGTRSTKALVPFGTDVLEDEVLFTQGELKLAVTKLAKQINKDYAFVSDDEELVLMGLLSGVFMFQADLCREITVPHQIDFVVASSYGSSTVSAGNVKIKKDSNSPVKGKHVILVDEMCDSGRTMACLKALMESRDAKSVRSCVMFDKQARRICNIECDYVGLNCPDEFVVGYGMDWGERFRSIPHVCVVKSSAYSS